MIDVTDKLKFYESDGLIRLSRCVCGHTPRQPYYGWLSEEGRIKCYKCGRKFTFIRRVLAYEVTTK